MKKCKQAMNDNTCDKDCCCYYCEDFETCGHACSNYDDKEDLEQNGCEEQFDEETALKEFNKDSDRPYRRYEDRKYEGAPRTDRQGNNNRRGTGRFNNTKRK